MGRVDGSTALKLDFGGVTTTAAEVRGRRTGLRLAAPGTIHGPHKYRELERRRRQAQIRARHLLDLMAGE